jgi:hypothetical protein
MAVRQTRMEILQAVPLFSELSQRQLRSVARACSEVRYVPGETMLRELDWGQQ